MEAPKSFLKGMNLFLETNNARHHTSEITVEKLILRRGHSFLLSVKLTEPFNPVLNPLHFTVQTGNHPNEDTGTMSSFSIPDNVQRSASAKAIWKAEFQKSSSIKRGSVILIVTPPADCPIGKYKLLIKYKGEEILLTELVVLFNPWCPDDTVFMTSEKKKEEYVLNESGVVYRGTANYIHPLDWDFGQFEEDMVDICMLILDKSVSYQKDPALDVASRNDPIHVGRVLSAMINSEDDDGILWGNWSGCYDGGYSPSHWSGSHAILHSWFINNCQSVKYGQCWVFACVMCSVMRLLGIPCRVVSNFVSAHDGDRNLTIDSYYNSDGIETRQSPDSVWNFHVWVEAWFKRPDLEEHGNFDGWQVLDPTPQETSGGLYCCGPAPVKAIKKGCTDLKYDIPFIFAEVNADCVDWRVKEGDETSIEQFDSDTKRVGQNISTKSVGCKQRRDITEKYKHKEGTDMERVVFKYATTRDYSRVDHVDDEDDENTDEDEDDDEDDDEDANSGSDSTGEAVTEPPVAPRPKLLSIEFEEVTQPINGEDVSLNLLLHSDTNLPLDLTANITVQAMRYNGVPASNIQSEEKTYILLPWKHLTIPILVPYKKYHTHMVKCESMKFDAMISQKGANCKPYLAECDVVLLDPELTLIADDEVRLGQLSMVELIFENPVEEMLRNCNLTVNGSGLFKDDFECKLPDLKTDNRVRVKLFFRPRRKGLRTLLADFDCSEFRDIKASKTINVIL